MRRGQHDRRGDHHRDDGDHADDHDGHHGYDADDRDDTGVADEGDHRQRRQGVPQGGIQRPTIDKGDKVVLVVRTDSGEAVHLHGYNIEKEVVPGKAVRLPFTANIAGRFEVELHPTDALLAVLEVQP